MTRALATVVVAAMLGACTSADVDESDRDALFLDARFRKELEGEPDHEGNHVESGWRQTSGEKGGVDYRISTLAVGLGADSRIGESCWAGVVGSFAWQQSDVDAPAEDLDREDAYGPNVAVQGGWMATRWLEAFARADFGLYFPDFSTALGFEAGARFHVVEHAALFVGWRYTVYDLQDLDSFTSVDHVELDASGLALGLELAF